MTLTARQRTTRKGYATMLVARRLFEARGCLIEPARNVVRWINGKPLSLRHDFFGVWDAIVVYRGAKRPKPECKEQHTLLTRRFFIQVTDVGNMSHRREKILVSGFPCSVHDLILGYRGRGWFRVLRGPLFDGAAEEWKAPPKPKQVKRAKETV